MHCAQIPSVKYLVTASNYKVDKIPMECCELSTSMVREEVIMEGKVCACELKLGEACFQ